MISEVIILAGGLGTRLRDTVPDMPKSMADVAGRPMLEHIIRYWLGQGVRRFIFSLGYRSEFIEAFLRTVFPSLDYSLVVEDEPLGTGGAVRFAMTHARTDDVLVVNGDTLYRVSVEALAAAHRAHQAECTLALKPMSGIDRYGVVLLDDAGRITGFAEKQYRAHGLINGGVYLLNRRAFTGYAWPGVFSLERDYLEPAAVGGRLAGCLDDGYFIDIGVPADYVRAQADLRPPPFDPALVDRAWTLFLDRDGVINVNIPNDYVRRWADFTFEAGALDAIRRLSGVFGRIIVITNQRGIGKGWMTEADLADIHQRMQAAIEDAGGRIDAVYYCAAMDDKQYCRKPNPGMAFQARADFPEIDFSRSVMCGDKAIDMQWARNIGAFGMWIMPGGDGMVRSGGDRRFPSLRAFAEVFR